MKVNLGPSTHTAYKPILETTAPGCRRTVDRRHKAALAKGELLDQTTLSYRPQPLRLEGTTPSAQQFLLPEAEITRGETYCVSAKSLWDCREQHTWEPAETEPTDPLPKISSLLLSAYDNFCFNSVIPALLRGGRVAPMFLTGL